MYKLNKNLSHYSFKEVKEVLQEINRTEGISSQLLDMYTLIYWLKDDVPNATMYAEKTINLCPDKFSTPYFVLGVLNYDYRNYQISVDYLNKAKVIGIKQEICLPERR